MLIRGGHLVDPAAGRDGKYDVLVKDGVITGPLEQMTIAGNFFEVLKNIVAVGSDMYTDIGSAMLIMPSVMISEIAVAGE